MYVRAPRWRCGRSTWALGVAAFVAAGLATSFVAGRLSPPVAYAFEQPPDPPGLLDVSWEAAPASRVTGIVDERTVLLVDARGRQRRVRLLGVAGAKDAAERAAAVAFLEHLLIGESVHELPHTVGTPRSDEDEPSEESATADPADDSVASRPAAARANRAALLFRGPDGLCVGLELVRQGYLPAAARPEFDEQEIFHAHEQRARSAGRGIWGAELKRPTQKRPAVTPAAGESGGSKPEASADEAVFVTRSGKRYHRAGCQYVRVGATEIALSQARAKYSPCSRCKPPP